MMLIRGPRRALLSLPILVLAACGTGAKGVIPTLEPSPTLPALTGTPSPQDIATEVAPSSSPIPATAVPAATSRGPDLESTDPETVKLDAGNLQLVEFFRFT